MQEMDPEQAQQMSALARYRRQRARRQKYLRRRAVLLLVLAGLGAALFLGGRWAYRTLRKPGEASTPPAPLAAGTKLLFTPESHLPAPDLNGDGIPEQIAIGPAESALRKVALTTGGTGAGEKAVGQVLTVPDFPLTMRDLPRAKQVLVQEGALLTEGEPVTELVQGKPAVRAAGGEPDYKAWRLDNQQGLVPVDYYPLAAPLSSPAPDYLLVDKYLNVLWHYAGGELAATYRVATGRHLKGPAPTLANQADNLLTPTGRYAIVNKSLARPYYKQNIPAGDPRNPLGTRWIGFSVFPGDGGNLWSIHGTNEPDSIGRWASDGCIRLTNANVEKLYESVTPDKTILEIVDSSMR